jgi:hypothetical protein
VVARLGALVTVVMLACSGGAAPGSIVGEWQVDEQLYAFNSDTTFFVTSFGHCITGTYSVSGNMLKVVTGDAGGVAISGPYSIDGNTLTVTSVGQSVQLTRVNSNADSTCP